MLRGGRGVEAREARLKRAVRSQVAQVRQHLLLEDPLAVLVGQVGRAIPRRRVQLDLAVAQAVIQVEQDREPIIEALASDAVLVDERDRRRAPLPAACRSRA